MSEASDHWFIRLPDGRVLRAANTTVVRQQVVIGKIPPNSSVRRSPEDEWTALEWTREFADLKEEAAAAAGRREAKSKQDADDAVDLGADLRPDAGEGGGLSARLDRSRLPTIGVRAMAHELLAALDATLVRKKLAAAALAGLAAGLVLASWLQTPDLPSETAAPWCAHRRRRRAAPGDRDRDRRTAHAHDLPRTVPDAAGAGAKGLPD